MDSAGRADVWGKTGIPRRGRRQRKRVGVSPAGEAREVSDENEERLTPEQEVLRALQLPFRGEFPFVPPKRWSAAQPLHGPSSGGYFDIKGRLWKKGRSVTAGQYFEWDVQLPGGSHVNVDWTGRITHPRPKSSKRFKGRRKRR
jgi:hypothetical protein